MRYYSTNKQSPVVDFKEATINGQAPDKGLYFPEFIPQVDKALIGEIESISNEEIAFRVIRPYIGDAIPEEKLFQIVRETINFQIPLVKINDRIFSLELYHGPTLAFKDVGARFMSRCLGYFVSEGAGPRLQQSWKGVGDEVTVLVATSGDTGGAVANGFYNVDGVNVVILYPSGKVSPVQEMQLTTPGKNIHALEVQGTFDDCQQMVKQAFADADINKKLFLTSANSINVARWLPQQFYYFFAYKQWLTNSPLRPARAGTDGDGGPVISVPSGNFGNICAGILAMQSGLPVKHFVAACNANDVVSGYLQTQDLKPRQAVPTLSNAMDVGNPSNFVRLLEIFGHQFPELKSKLSSYSISDEETLAAISEVYKNENYLLDPHGAVGYLSLQRYLAANPAEKGIFLETAHPVKFPDTAESATGHPVSLPSAIQAIVKQQKKSILIRADYSQLKEYLLK